MSRHQPSHEGAPDAPGDVRALPARPNLEFERKQAKKLLRQLKKAEPEALARVHAKLKQSVDTPPDEFQLSDAQFTIAREYGFTSWPKLVEYFEALARHEISGSLRQHDPRSLENWAQTIHAEHKDKRLWTAQSLGAYVPRLYGKTTEEIFAAEVTLDEAKLAAARMYRYPSWEVMIANSRAWNPWVDESETPFHRALKALRDEDLDALAKLCEQYPELLSPVESTGHPRSHTLGREVVLMDIKSATPGSRRIYDWLCERVNLRETLNWMLLGYMRMEKEQMQRLLDLGADPNWKAPNGFTVLEHVIWRSWNGEVADLIASRVKPRKAFWVAAGLGDAAAVKRYVDERGVPTEAARRNRPDFNALSHMPWPMNPSTDDETILWEAFLVAAFNQRYSVLDVLIDRGFPIDYMQWGQPILHLAVGNGWVEMVEYLVKRGANVNLKGWRPYQTAREMAESHAMNPNANPNALRILELCGGRDIETLRRERAEARAKRVMGTHPNIENVFDSAKQDAVRMGRSAVGQENLLVGLLRQSRLTVSMLGHAGVDLKQLRASLIDRLDHGPVDVPAEMTANPEVSSILMDARTLAEGRKDNELHDIHVLHALVQRASPQVLNRINADEVTREKILKSIENALPPAP
jgi:hypothetical protein